MEESFAVQVVLTVSSAGAGMGIGRQVSKCEKTCLCIAGRVQYGLAPILSKVAAVKRHLGIWV